jgi:hypothetical protein
LLLLMGLTLLATPTLAQQSARTLSGAALYARCYAHLTGRRVPFSDASFQAVRAGTMDALSACEGLLDSAALTTDGVLAAPAGPAAGLVLNHFYDVYRSWFTEQRFDEAVPMFEYTVYTWDVYDATRGGLFLAWATFGQNVRYASVVTHPNPVSAVRGLTSATYSVAGPLSRTYVDAHTPPFTFLFQTGYKYDPTTRATNNHAPLEFWNVTPIPVGELVGISSGPAEPLVLPKSFINPFALSDGSQYSYAVLGDAEPNFAGQFDVRTSIAPAGLIGTREYLMLNIGHDYVFTADGALNNYRRWSRNLVSDLLCRDVPVLREGDVTGYLVTDPQADGVPPFRKSLTCLRCHATMDPMAYTLRNVRWVNAAESGPDDPDHQGYDTAHVSTYSPQVDAPFTWSSTAVPDFKRQTPHGHVYFRSFDGTLIDRQVTGPEGVGAALADTADLYVCAAKRHFKMLTGIDVSLHDMGDSANEALNRSMSPKDVEYRQYVVSLGLALKQSGDVRAMIKTILHSKYYALSDYGKLEASP